MSTPVSTDAPSSKTDAFIDKCRLAPYQNGVLTGLTFAVKDLIDVRGRHTGCGNPTWKETHPPAAANAVCIEQLLHEGATCLGKTVTDELAFDLSGENHFYGTPVNPRCPDRVPGGSSSGSASAVAAGYVDFALGTDTAGSIRVPASNCGLFGFRPSPGAISIAGVAPFSPGFDTVGILAPSAETLAKVGGVLLSTTVPSVPTLKRFFLLKETFEIVSEETRKALEKPLADLISKLGVKAEELSLRRIDREPTDGWLENWLATFRAVRDPEVWSTLGSWIEGTQPTFGPRIATNFEYSKNADRQKTASAIKMRETLYRRAAELLQDGDILCMPTTHGPAPRKGEIGKDRYKNPYIFNTLCLTSISGICRLPEATMPLATVDGAPVGLSLLAKQGNDVVVLAAVVQACKTARS